MLGQIIVLPFACNTPLVPQSSELVAANTKPKPQFTSAQQCSCKGNGGVPEHILWREKPNFNQNGREIPGNK
jgi:hypothetical protein